ncbi:hypothetical protein [Pseudomonas fluorescens]|uniref:hypothetical protein n=1 Tax=Pseudomonas TaxID=286 RepID=UPI003CFE811E
MNTMTESALVQRINAQCHPLMRYLHKLSGVRYLAAYDAAGSYELNPINGHAKHATDSELANTEVWERLP